jgi:hypothetical protein
MDRTPMNLSKPQAAARILDAAIRLFFAGGDAVAVHALAASSANLFSELAMSGESGGAWRERLRDDSSPAARAMKDTLNRAWNLFRHSQGGSDETLHFDPMESEYLIFFAVLECGDHQATSCCMEVFQLWYIAAHPERFPRSVPEFDEAMKTFSGLASLPPLLRIRRGRAVLEKSCPPEPPEGLA